MLWLAGAGPAWDAWRAAFIALQQSSGGPAAADPAIRAVTQLAEAARSACPGPRAVLVVSDDPLTWLRGNYLLYPRRLDVVQSVDGFTPADLDAHAGGCLFTYGGERARIDPFRPRLSPVACVADDCVYRVTDGQPR